MDDTNVIIASGFGDYEAQSAAKDINENFVSDDDDDDNDNYNENV